jgi:hypothetical protein
MRDYYINNTTRAWFTAPQVALSVALQSKRSGFEFAVSTTHLKARKGPLMAAMRNEQAADLVEHIKRLVVATRMTF